MPSIWSPIAHLEHFKRGNRKLNDLYEQFHAANVQSLQLMRMGMGFTQHMTASRVSEWKQTLEQLGFDEGNVMTFTLLWSQGLPGRSLCNLLLTIWLRDDRLKNLKYQFAPQEYQRMMRQARRLVDMPPKKHKDMLFWSPPDALNGDLWIQQHFSPYMVHSVGHPSTWNTPAFQRVVKWAKWLNTREPLGSAPRNAPVEDYHKPKGMTYGPKAHPPPTPSGEPPPIAATVSQAPGPAPPPKAPQPKAHGEDAPGPQRDAQPPPVPPGPPLGKAAVPKPAITQYKANFKPPPEKMQQWYLDLADRAMTNEKKERYLARATEVAQQFDVDQVDHYGQKLPQPMVPKKVPQPMVPKKAPPVYTQPPPGTTKLAPGTCLLTEGDWDDLLLLHLLLTQPYPLTGPEAAEVIRDLGEALFPHLVYLAYNVNREGFEEFFISYQMNGGQESGLTAEDLVNIASKAYTSRSSTPEGETVSELLAKEFIDFIQAGAPGFALEPDAEAEPAAPGYAHEPGGERDEDNQPNNKKAR